MKAIVATFMLAAAGTASAQAVVGQTAPSFTATDVAGKTVSSSQFKGKYVVLEWFNPSCPFVQKHYNSGNMPAVQKYAVDKGVVWLSVHTTYESTSEEAAALGNWMKSHKATPSSVLVDAKGTMGKTYGAKATPHMYVIDPSGKLVYAGAIDSKPTANPADIKTATNYVVQALDESLAGKAVSKPVTQAYGCSVKYSWTGLW
ncbi:redoxin domain-containing protein [Noviherbaspirillum sp. CPCC 100848]|uniref:Redoxin domain-containing protein n=1 Tax=Noviherbaspirillum album TaxID=3080276 RepID=A0ABU6J4G1_9BURK|nr:redoxin domain-containing protein [Noviherbaspirillum sp. CPCC 100848]MEC4718410.1 redoxin domain-containing protein [Noviherbaspirillum sp. CPCC 100848]